MTADLKRSLITTFCDNVRDSALRQVDRMPEEWDGHELREFLAESFERERTSLMRSDRRRRMAYRRERLRRDINV